MGKIFYIMGKSSSGKDTIFKSVSEQMPELKTIVLYTTRPIRAGEREGKEYYFVEEEKRLELEQAGKVIESRTYQTVHGLWSYFTVDDGQIDLEEENYIVIGTLESYEKMCHYFGRAKMVPIYIEIEDGERLTRAMKREQSQKEPKYEELCRRFLADARDFSGEELKRQEITKRFVNLKLDDCTKEILLYIREQL